VLVLIRILAESRGKGCVSEGVARWETAVCDRGEETRIFVWSVAGTSNGDGQAVAGWWCSESRRQWTEIQVCSTHLEMGDLN
jgi:hypothetical protein